MEESQKITLAEAWMAAQEATEDSKEREENAWAIGEMIHLPIDHPEETWNLILWIHSQALSEKVRGMLAAGPLEDLMVYHGAQYIGHVEELASKDSLFKETMAGVWLDPDESPVCEQFYEIAGVEKPFPKGLGKDDS